MKIITLLFSLLIATNCIDAVAAKPEKASPSVSKTQAQDTVVHSEVDKLVALMTDGVADGGHDPIIVYAPPDSPYAGAAVVLFGIEGWNGGNASIEFLAVFEQTDASGWSPDWKPNPYHLAALTSAKGSMQWGIYGHKLMVDKNGVITIEGVTWGPDDPHCCPKKPVTIKFKYVGFELIEVK